MTDAKALVSDLFKGDRRALAKIITLLESQLDDDASKCDQVLQAISQVATNSIRIGISGIPGVGKSTFIEAFGQCILSKTSMEIAILAVDPSSSVSGGSILGDRTRMPNLSAHDRVFIRPSPSSGTLGGVARKTRESIMACEAAGYEVVLVETMGVGQSEALVASMVDVFLLLQMPHTGDEIQGIKKGILELADVVAVTKADGVTLPGAKLAKQQLENALHLTRGNAASTPQVIVCSAIEGHGIEDVWTATTGYLDRQRQSGSFDERRAHQREVWFLEELTSELSAAILRHQKLKIPLASTKTAVRSGKLAGSSGARQVVKELLRLLD